MCGICGFWGDPTGIHKAKMLKALRHRGPDHEGTYEKHLHDGILWLGHRRLSILDLSHSGNQPMISSTGRFVVTYNGEIYNFREIRFDLEKSGYRFKGHSDTEVLLASWERWGIEAIQHFCGMFAFALWDNKERSLWLVRDRMGEKPLYYWIGKNRVIFASEVSAILDSGEVDRRMDSDGLDAYLTFGSVAEPHTLVKGVWALEAGHWLRICHGKRVCRSYWDIAEIPESLNSSKQTQAVKATRTRLLEATRMCMVSDVPVAVLLSGGIDSSSNVVLLKEQAYQNLKTFSVVFEGAGSAFNEEKWSDLIAKRFNTHHTKVVVNLAEAREWVPEAVKAMDQPSVDGINTYIVSRAIAAHGIKVAVSGQGADELFLGYWQRRMFPFILFLARLPVNSFRPVINRLVGRWESLHDTRYEKIIQTLGAKDSLSAAYLAQHTIFSQKGIERLRGSKRPPQLCFVNSSGGRTPLGKLSRLELRYYLRNTLLRDADQMSMANSLELRAPFLNHRLVEDVVALPVDLKVQSARQKPLLVDAVGSGLPRCISDRPKQGFTLPFNIWLRAGLCLSDVTAIEMGLDKRAIKKVVLRFEGGQNWSRYWALQVLAAWISHKGMNPPED